MLKWWWKATGVTSAASAARVLRLLFITRYVYCVNKCLAHEREMEWRQTSSQTKLQVISHLLSIGTRHRKTTDTDDYGNGFRLRCWVSTNNSILSFGWYILANKSSVHFTQTITHTIMVRSVCLCAWCNHGMQNQRSKGVNKNASTYSTQVNCTDHRVTNASIPNSNEILWIE